jgi:hypothetical protein
MPAITAGLPPEAYWSSQVVAAVAGIEPPLDPAVPPGPPVTTVAQLGITATTPYPTTLGPTEVDYRTAEAERVVIDRS